MHQLPAKKITTLARVRAATPTTGRQLDVASLNLEGRDRRCGDWLRLPTNDIAVQVMNTAVAMADQVIENTVRSGIFVGREGA
jgi:hypothetical protein